MSRCLSCRADAVVPVLDVGPQPIATHFLQNADTTAPTHPIALGLCERCGLLQLLDFLAPAELVPPYDWITVNEPERHLDDLADLLAEVAGGERPVAAGASFKDDSLLRRLGERGFETWRLDPKADLGGRDGPAAIATLQERLGETAAAAVAQRRGPASVVVARQILEHMTDPRRFIAALGRLAHAGGLVVLEIPDCARSLEKLDYTMLWEEHTAYFTERTFCVLLEAAGFEIVRTERYSYPVDDSLVAVVRAARSPAQPQAAPGTLDEERGVAEHFAGALPGRRTAWSSYLDGWAARGPVALFGAGHLSCMFLSVMGVGDRVAFVADDDPNKQGLLMPGSGVPIRGSAALLDEGVALCLLGVGPESEDAIVCNNGAFVERGGVIGSLLPASARAVVF